MKRPWLIWTAFGLCLLLVLAAMSWTSHTVLRLERAEARARRQAADAEVEIRRRTTVEENVRLALWRMDSTLAPIIAQENARPYFAYQPFHPAERAYTRMYRPIEKGDVLIPSPLLRGTPRFVRVHFQYAPDGALTSPQAPDGNMRDLAETYYVTHESVIGAAERLARLGSQVDRAGLLARLSAGPPEPAPPPVTGRAQAGQIEMQVKRSMAEQQARFQQIDELPNLEPRTHPPGEARSPGEAAPKQAPAVRGGALEPVWVNGALLLARRVAVDGREYVQGCWLDWPALRAKLLAESADLLPNADLVRAGDAAGSDSRLLAALPVRLAPGDVPVELPPAPGPDGSTSPVAVSLGVAWACVVLAAAAVAALLSGVVSLSERRGAFVSAVTHEMRTPLTTFRMYTEMLADGMVPEEKRRGYLETLRSEAERLGHLVENVLAYARLGRGGGAGQFETLPVTELWQRVESRIARRAEQAEMRLEVDAGAVDSGVAVRADPAAVEQILFNLVDNACKYARTADDRRIHLRLAAGNGAAELHVRDHGPGIPDREGRRLFRPFRKSARDAAHSAPGIGLGLALSRRLARQMRGDLRLEPSASDGACFVLRLPLAGAGRASRPQTP
ncbi:MAG: sensor histidine kinase [bacterium]